MEGYVKQMFGRESEFRLWLETILIQVSIGTEKEMISSNMFKSTHKLPVLKLV